MTGPGKKLDVLAAENLEESDKIASWLVSWLQGREQSVHLLIAGTTKFKAKLKHQIGAVGEELSSLLQTLSHHVVQDVGCVFILKETRQNGQHTQLLCYQMLFASGCSGDAVCLNTSQKRQTDPKQESVTELLSTKTSLFRYFERIMY